MPKEINHQGKILYQCQECGHYYETKELAQSCENWCREHKSCHLEIIKKAVKVENIEEIKEQHYFVKGMHCSSCEILIEKKILEEMKNVKSVEANVNHGEVIIKYIGEKPKLSKLNDLFEKENYVFSEEPFKEKKTSFINIFLISFSIILLFLLLNRTGLTSLVDVSSKSSLPTFFFLGLIAGFSTCAALIGGLVLSMSKNWANLYRQDHSTLTKLEPHLMFNLGRIVSYVLLGGLLGFIGAKLQLSLTFSSFLIILISFLMIFLGLQMLGVKGFSNIRLALPKFMTRSIIKENNFKSKYAPFTIGFLTFFLPCGFTLTAQSLALISGNPIQASLIMFLFALGTTPSLLLIGLSSVKLYEKPHLGEQFSKVAGILVLFFALFNINSQLNLLGYPNLTDLNLKIISKIQSLNENNKQTTVINNEKQIIKMDAYAYKYSPSYFRVKAGIPVRWEITDKGTSGCTNAIIAKGLIDEPIPLERGKTVVREFIPQKPGLYKFTCWMGMVTGFIEVVK